MKQAWTIEYTDAAKKDRDALDPFVRNRSTKHSVKFRKIHCQKAKEAMETRLVTDKVQILLGFSK